MPAGWRAPSVHSMSTGTIDRWFDAVAPSVYGAALAAACDRQVALEVAGRVLERAALEPVVSLAELVDRAILLAFEAGPAEGFAALPPRERAAVGLARLAGRSVGEIARALERDERDLRAALLAGLRRCSATQPARPRAAVA